MPDQPTADLRTLAAEALVLHWNKSDASATSPYEVDDDALGDVDAILAAVLPAHRATVLAEAAEAIEDACECGGDPGWALECDCRRLAGVLRRLAATGPAASLPAVRDEAVPEEGPDGHSGAQGDGQQKRLILVEMTEFARVNRELTELRSAVTEMRPADCGHDLEAYERQAAKVVELMTERDEARAELTCRRWCAAKVGLSLTLVDQILAQCGRRLVLGTAPITEIPEEAEKP